MFNWFKKKSQVPVQRIVFLRAHRSQVCEVKYTSRLEPYVEVGDDIYFVDVSNMTVREVGYNYSRPFHWM